MREMENRMRPAEGKPNLAIEMGSQPFCERDHLHFPRNHNTEKGNHNTEKDTANKSTQDTVTFE